ncbi:hypothetical protein OZD61_03790 [Wolbachia endosymbiont of Drosophila bocki]|uniref:TomO hydrophobic C-terminal domain-containing protein n=1 Tax=Wolbachia endosymbiont of Drosophila bocki TaxID=3002576 RepID=UPI0023AA01E7|nr:hypothetical protein [Wolbachia endosymbiont of Drosophila bocki]MDE5057895.1 hypothetical protein [Wolbachia endosymbiont of Drosophila bocki]
MQIRNILQFFIDVQKYSCHERQDLWDEMCQTPGTFIIRKRSNNVADELEIPVITSDILSENPGLESAGSKQTEKNIVDRGTNIMNNEEVSIEEAIGNNYEEGEMGKRSEKKGVTLLASFVRKKISEIISKGNDNLNLEEEFKNVLTFDNRDSVLEYAKSQEGPFKDKVVAFLTLQKNKKNGAQINGKQSTNPSNTVLSVQPTTPETPNASSSENSFQLEGDQDTQPLLLQSSVSGDEHSGTPSNPSSEYVVIPSGSGSSSPIQDIVNEEEHVATKINNEEVSTFKDNDSLENIQPETSDGNGEREQNSAQLINMPESEDQEQTPVQLAGHVSQKDDNKKDTQPKPAPEPIPTSSVANKISEQEDDTQTNGKLPNNPGNGSITAAQNTQKSKWPTVATWTFAVAGILAGAAAPAAYFAFSVSLLTTGIIAGVGACCLVAAAIIYYCTPKSQVENNEVEKSFNTGKVPTAVHV